MSVKTTDVDRISRRAVLIANQYLHETQQPGDVLSMANALSVSIRRESVENLHRLLACSIVVRDIYARLAWQSAREPFPELLVLLEKHRHEQTDLVDRITARILLGDHPVAIVPDVVHHRITPDLPKGRGALVVDISRLLYTHDRVVREAHTLTHLARTLGEESSDVLASEVMRVNEHHASCVSEIVLDLSLAFAG